MADNLKEILDIARRECPEVPAEVWERISMKIRITFGGQRHYIAGHKKRARLEALAEIGVEEDATRIAQVLGVSVRRAQQLKKLT